MRKDYLIEEKGETKMKNWILKLIGILGSGIVSILGIRKMLKARKIRKDLEKENKETMNKILANQQSLLEACNNDERKTEQLMELLKELKERVDADSYSDPREYDIEIE